MVNIGRLQGPEHSHSAQSKDTAKMPKMYDDAFSSSKIQDMQASYKAFKEATEKNNPLLKRELKPYKKGEYPLGKQIPGPLRDIPSNRVGG